MDAQPFKSKPKAQAFKALRVRGFRHPQPWDAGSAKMLASLGYQALATTSAGYAFSKARPMAP
jgi:2-methylisocitrate lyase-like PEP mutase family enzyme